jgi:reactive intermediate/imine deaminase
MRICVFLFLTFCALGAELKVITPAGGRPPVGPYSPGIMAGDYLYVSGQGAAKSDGSFPETAEQQVEQCLNNVKRIVEASGLTMQHVVYAHLYLKDISKYEDANRAWAKFFPKDPPARATLGVAKMPTDTPVEITVTAFRDLGRRKIIGTAGREPVSPAVIAGNRLYFSGMMGRDKAGNVPSDPAQQVDAAFSQLSETLKAAGMDFRHIVFVNPYLTADMPMNVMNKVYASKFEFGNTPARATIQVAGLPNGANIEFTGVAIADLTKRIAVRPKNMSPSATASPCVFADDTFYCSAKSGFIPGPQSGIYSGTVEGQLRQTMRNLLDGLEEAGLKFSNVVATNVYLDDVNDFAKMNKVYAEYFSSTPPTRTTVQQVPAIPERKGDARDRWPTLEQISLIAVK